VSHHRRSVRHDAEYVNGWGTDACASPRCETFSSSLAPPSTSSKRLCVPQAWSARAGLMLMSIHEATVRAIIPPRPARWGGCEGGEGSSCASAMRERPSPGLVPGRLRSGGVHTAPLLSTHRRACTQPGSSRCSRISWGVGPSRYPPGAAPIIRDPLQPVACATLGAGVQRDMLHRKQVRHRCRRLIRGHRHEDAPLRTLGISVRLPSLRRCLVYWSRSMAGVRPHAIPA